MERSSPDSSAQAETLLLDAIASSAEFDSGDLARLCAARPELAPELRTLYGKIQQGRSLVGALSPSPEAAPAATGFTPPIGSDLAAEHEPRYRVEREIARGGMSIILEVWDSRLRRHMAMKRLRPVEPGQPHGTIERERRRERLFHEAQVLAQLAHPGIVPMYDVARDQHGDPYFTMLLVRGEDLSAIFRRTWDGNAGWNLSRAVGVLQRFCESVAYAHEKGVIHRDLKPANVMVGAFGETYVMDWGLARAQSHATPEALPVERVGEGGATDEKPPGSRPSSAISLVRTDRADVRHASSSSPLLTQEGDVVGTPAYMSPEQAEGRLDDIGAPSDVYSAGAMLYELLAHHPPYCDEDSNRSPHDVLHDVRREAPEPLRKAARTAPDELIAICDRAMEREPARRYASMRALADELRAFLENRVVRAHRTGALVELRKWVQRNRWAAIAAGILVAALAGIALVQTLLKREVDLARKATEARAEELRREDYFNRVALAGSALEKGQIARVRELLDGSPADLRGWEWRHLARERDTSDAVLEGSFHSNGHAYFTPDGCSLLTSEEDGRVLVRDAHAGGIQHEILGPGPREPDPHPFSADGRFLAEMGAGDELRLWDIRSWEPLPSLTVGYAREDRSALFAPRGGWIAISGSGPIEVWDIDRRELVCVLDASQDHPSAAWSADGTRLYAGAWDGSISVWEVPSGKLVSVLREHQERIGRPAVSPDGKWFVSSGWESRLLVWNAETLTVAHVEMLTNISWSSAWSKRSQFLAIADGSVVRVLEAGSWAEHGRLVGHEKLIVSIDFDREGRRALTCDGGAVRTWDLGRQDRWTYRGTRGDEPLQPCFSGDGRWLLVPWPKAGRVELWSVADRSVVRTLRITDPVGATALSHEGTRLAIALGSKLRIMDPWTGQVLGEIPGVDPLRTSFDPTGARLCVLSQDGRLSVWDTRSFECAFDVAAHSGPPEWPGRLAGGSWSPDGTRIVTLAVDGRVQLWDARNGTLLREARGSARFYNQATFALDGQTMFLASAYPGAIERWDVASLAPRWTQRGWLVVPPFSYAYPGGGEASRVFALASSTLNVHDAASGRLIVSLPTDGYLFNSLAVSPGGDLVVTASNRGVRLWDTRPWR